ncbi:MAG: hypothetical protein ACI4PM_03205 [Butyricicoccus sp.]
MKLFDIKNLSAFYSALADCSSPVSVTLTNGECVTLPSSQKLVSDLMDSLVQHDCIPSVELHFASNTDCVRVINSSHWTKATKPMSI